MLISLSCLKLLKSKLPILMRPAFMVMTISLLYSGVSFGMAYRSLEEINRLKPAGSRLTAVEILESRRNNAGRMEVWVKCVCTCGLSKEMTASNMAKRILSCGCLIAETLAQLTPTKYKTIEDVILRKPKDSWLTPIEFIERIGEETQKKIKCLCNCGRVTEIRISSFVSGKCRSCGCLLDVSRKEKHYIGNVDNIYRVYRSMLNRCRLKTNPFYKNYGAKGVTVCKEWVDNYQTFLDWALANGWKNGLQLDKDIKYREKYPEAKTGKLYSPEFCQFVTHQKNNDTRSNTRYFMYEGQQRTCKQISQLTGIDSKKVYARLTTGVPLFYDKTKKNEQ